MKHILFLAILCFSLFSCQTKTVTLQDPDTATQLNYPFKAKHSLKWQPGDEKNALIVLDCLKHYVAGDMKGAMQNFADTTTFISDDFYFKGKKDSLATILGQVRSDMADLSKSFDRWITIYYPDRNETHVILWYCEKWTDKKGKTDSLYYCDDVLLKQGKILVYDEKLRHYPAPAAK